jgi:hypothetical protein
MVNPRQTSHEFMSSIGPSDAELAQLIDCETLSIWCGLDNVAPAPPTPPALAAAATAATVPTPVSPVTAFLGFTGMSPTAHYRTLAAIPPSMWDTMIASFTVNGKPATMREFGAAKLFHSIARCICKLDPWPGAAAPNPALSAANVAPVTTTPPSSITSRILNTPVVKVDQVLDQKISDEITYLPQADIVKYQHNYWLAMETRPTPDVSVTTEQLTALEYIVKSGRAPYADFGIFGKFGVRTLRRIKLTAIVMLPGGEFRTVELQGPATLQCWYESYDCLVTALIMLDTVRRPRLAKYRKKMEYLHSQFGEATWGLLYQADIRCRGEHMDALHFEHLHAHNAAVTAQRPSQYNAQMPWDDVWEAAMNDSEWWKAEFELPASRIIFGKALPREVQQAASAAAPPAQKALMAEQPIELCKEFNKGKCAYSSTTQCPRHPRRLHKCSLCGSEAHGATTCGGKAGGKAKAKAKNKRQEDGWSKHKGAKGKKWKQ